MANSLDMLKMVLKTQHIKFGVYANLDISGLIFPGVWHLQLPLTAKSFERSTSKKLKLSI